jgi:hypothetical protein
MSATVDVGLVYEVIDCAAVHALATSGSLYECVSAAIAAATATPL